MFLISPTVRLFTENRRRRIFGTRACLEYIYRKQGGDEIDDRPLLREDESRNGGDLSYADKVT